MTLVGNSHLVAGGGGDVEALIAFLGKEGITVSGNADAYVRIYAHFGVEEARELRSRASSRAFSGGQRIFIIASPVMTAEAQNALLKTFEESPSDAQFFVIVPSPEMLLPTLRSRMQVLGIETKASGGLVDAQSFLAASPAQRLDMLKPLLEKDDDERRDTAGIITFLSSLEHRLQRHPEGLRAVYRARKYLGDKGALIKPLLEQVALLTPRV
jgi:hypothetical protein